MKKYKITVSDEDYEVTVKPKGRKLEVTVDGNIYQVAVGEGTEQGKNPKSEQFVFKNKTIVAPIPGVVAQLKVKVGDKVSKGSVLVVIMAMKMENEIKADCPGTVEKIQVKVGDQLKKDQLIMKLK